jgi:hypothetical protein
VNPKAPQPDNRDGICRENLADNETRDGQSGTRVGVDSDATHDLNELHTHTVGMSCLVS